MEGTQVASLYAKLSADVTELQRGLQQARADLDKTSKHADTTSKNAAASISRNLAQAGSGLASLGQRLTIGVTLPIVGAGAAMTRLAMNAVESENLFEVSLGKMAGQARAWSEQVSASLKLNAYQVRQQLGTWDVMIKSFGLSEDAAFGMSKQLTILAQDMASFYNLSVSDAFEKLQSGIAGEIEPMRRLGININETAVETWALTHGLIKQGQELSEQGKVLARYGLILERTSAAQGDLARTAESPANRLRALQAQAEQAGITIGNQLLPIMVRGMETASSVIADVSSRWQEMGEAGQANIIKVAALLAVSGPLMSALGGVLGMIGRVGAAFLSWPAMAQVGVGGVLAATAGMSIAAARSGQMTYEEYNASRAYMGLPPVEQADYEKAVSPYRDAGANALNAATRPLEDYIADAERAAQRAKIKATPADDRSLSSAELDLRPKPSPYDEFLQNLKKYQEGIQTVAAKTGDALSKAAQAAKQRFDDLKDSLDGAKSKLQELLSTGLKGEKAYADKQFGISQEIAKLQLRIDDIKLSGKATPAKQRQITQLEKQIDLLRIKSDKLEQEASLAFDAQKRQLKELADPTVEKTYDELAAGIKEQRSQINLLTPQVNAAEEAYKALERQIRLAGEASATIQPPPVAPSPSPAPAPSPAPTPTPDLPNPKPGKGNRPYAEGGWITEPVLGVGLQSGASYSFAEHGSEYVSKGGGGGNVFNIGPNYVRNDGDILAIARAVESVMRGKWRQATAQGTKWPLGLAGV